jgi:cyclopropane-fatty-acyl-phospholipid synthase
MSTFAQKLAFRALQNIQGGRIILTMPDGSLHHFGKDDDQPIEPISILVRDTRVFQLIISRGDIGVAESYFKNYWRTDNLEPFLHLAIKNRPALEALIYGSWWGSLIYKIKHFFNKNTKSGSKKNIQAHYDLGNNFYSLWLDPTMMYSSAIFSGDSDKTLEQAQKDKCQRILASLNNQEGDHILEVGCGWGGFIKEAQANKIHIDAITISHEQHRFVQDQLRDSLKASSGEHPKCEVLLKDYRDCEKQYDGIVSIEMFEALGQQYWSTYFQILYSALKNKGQLIIQSITINDQDFSSYQKGTDFIQQYIFPGGALPSHHIFKKLAMKEGFKFLGHLGFGLDYGKTLKIWEENFQASLASG